MRLAAAASAHNASTRVVNAQESTRSMVAEASDALRLVMSPPLAVNNHLNDKP